MLSFLFEFLITSILYLILIGGYIYHQEEHREDLMIDLLHRNCNSNMKK